MEGVGQTESLKWRGCVLGIRVPLRNRPTGNWLIDWLILGIGSTWLWSPRSHLRAGEAGKVRGIIQSDSEGLRIGGWWCKSWSEFKSPRTRSSKAKDRRWCKSTPEERQYLLFLYFFFFCPIWTFKDRMMLSPNWWSCSLWFRFTFWFFPETPSQTSPGIMFYQPSVIP